MTFFGQTIKSDVAATLQCDDCDLIHISSVVLKGKIPPNERFQLSVAGQDGKMFVVAILSAEHPQHVCDMFVPDGTTVKLSGSKTKGVEADITGYSEPMGGMSSDDDDEETSSNDGEGADAQTNNLKDAIAQAMRSIDTNKTSVPAAAAAPVEIEESATSSSPKATKKSAAAGDAATKNVPVPVVDEDDSDDSDDSDAVEDSDDEEHQEGASADETTAAVVGDSASSESSGEGSGDDSGDENDSDDSDAESSDGEEVMAEPVVVSPPKIAGAKGKKQQQTAAPASVSQPKKVDSNAKDATSAGKKRKAGSAPDGAPPAKKSAGPDAEFETSIVAHLKALGGTSKISMIGSKVKKPEGVKIKLGAWLKERAAIFSVAGDTVTLKK